jgi:hypothetical protein
MTKRVIVWGTGNVGLHALRSVISHPGFELAGVIVHSESTNGRDAGELAGIREVGPVDLKGVLRPMTLYRAARA